MKDFHQVLKTVLKDIETQSKKFEKHRKEPFKIHAPRGDYTLTYAPDYYLKYKIGKASYTYLIFEFIDGQDETKTMADIIRIILHGGCRKAIFLVPKSKSKHKKKSKHDETNNIIEVILQRMVYKFGFESKKHLLDIVCLEIPIDEMSKDEIKSIILKEIRMVTRC